MMPLPAYENLSPSLGDRSLKTTCPKRPGTTKFRPTGTAANRLNTNAFTCPQIPRDRWGQANSVYLSPFPHPLGVRKTDTRDSTPTPRRTTTVKLQENTCLKCGQPITTTRGFITQHWDLTPIPRADATWVAFLSRPVLAIKQSGQVWRADLDRDHIDIPTTRDQTETWLPAHQCWSPPLPEAGPPINLDPPTTTRDFDLFNQPADDLPPY